MKPEVKIYKLSEICEIKAGKTPDFKNEKYWCQHALVERESCGCIPWYQGKDIVKQTPKPEKYITPSAVKENNQPLTTTNSLLFFALECLPFCLGKKNVSCYGGGPGIMILEPNPDLVVPEYLYYVLLNKREELKGLRGGSVQKFITKTELKNFPLSLPPLPIQKQILTKFQLVYNKIHKTEVVYQDTLLKILQKYLEIGDLLFLKYKDSEIQVGDEFRLVRGKTPPTGDYPLQKKKIPLEVVRNYPHLRAKTNYFLALFRLRHSISKAIHDFFDQEGFYYVPTPIITSNDAEGAGETFNLTTNNKKSFFTKPAQLTVSGQLHAEALAQGLGKVYTFSPCFRAEKSHTTRHLAEFWMVEPEMTFTDLEEIINLAEKIIKYVVDYVLNNNLEELEFFTNYNQKDLTKKLRKISKINFKRIDYNKCIEILVKNKKIFISSGIKYEEEVLQTEHEKYLCQYFDSPVFVLNYPRDLKAFYMKNNPDSKTVTCFDLLFPEIGELIGGSMREDNYQFLQEKADKQNLDINNLGWYFDLRKTGYAPSGGFGLGLERLIMFISGTENIQDTLAFPKFPGKLEF